MELTSLHATGIAVTLLGFLVVGIYSGRKVRSAVDFSVSGRQAGFLLVMGTILGTLVGGGSTIGTAQLAYLYGLSAWWFTLGGGFGCLIIALVLARPMRETRFQTIPRFLSSSYGPTAGVLAAVFVSLGMCINIVPQIIAVMALLASMAGIGPHQAAVGAVMLAVLYVIYGGAWSTGLMGFTKILLTCVVMVGVGISALHQAGGPAAIGDHFPSYPWFSLFGRGLNTDLAAAFALMVGVLSSQIYFQGIFSSRDFAAARGGALLSAVLGPVIGLGGILAGLFMRMHYPGIEPAQALPLYVIIHLSPLPAGVVLATLLLASIGTAAGLTLGVGTMLSRDLYLRWRPQTSDRQMLAIFRCLILIIMSLSLAVVLRTGGDIIILDWSYLSLGLRGATICFPLFAAIFLKKRISARGGTIAIIAGPVVVLIGHLLPIALNPLYPGLAVSALVLAGDYLVQRSRGPRQTTPR